MDKYNLNEHPKAKKVLRTFGPIILIVGIILLVASLVDFFSVDMWNPPTLSFLPFIAMPLMFIGSVMTMLGYMGSMARYQASQIAPVAKDVTNYMLDGTRDSISQTIGSVVREIRGTPSPEAKKEVRKPCPFCGEVPNHTAVFCDRCGRALTKPCPKCNHANDGDASFCEKCGTRL